MKIYGFWYSHVGWIVGPDFKETDYKTIGDYAKYPELVWLNKHYLVAPVTLAVIVTALGGIVNGDGIMDMFTTAGFSTLFIGFFLSTVILYHGTFSINSIMHKFGIGAALGGLLAIGGLPLTGGASSAATGTSPGQGVREVITLFSPTTQFKLVDLGDPGFSLGDQDVFTDDLLTKRRGKTVGFDGGVCSVVRVADASTQSGTLQCLVTYSLKQGQITTQGLVTVANGALEGTQVAAVTGGTRRFRNATGESAVTFLTPTEANVTLSIRR